ncbi:mRNA surveillance protein pelota [Candidatus Woesearchaeota archaeon]|jgi:protein pelota|nr:mRNA surveillance protein pelota [Candidatus Woesearchaeota archaeon]
MKILHFRKNEAKLVVENIDDLWQLSTIIDSGDTLKGKTFRKIKLGTAEERSQKITKKPVFLRIGIEKVEFHRYSDILRVSGKVLEGKEDIPKGSYHTFNVEAGTAITLIKPEWLKYQRQKLEEAAKEKKTDTLICVFDREEAYIALMKKYGFDILTELKGDIAKKAEVSQPVKNFYEEIIKTMQEYVKRHNIKHVILASPAFWKEELLKNLKDDELKQKMTLATCSSCDKSAINEVLKRPEVQTVLQQDRIAAEMNIVEDLLSEISKQGAAAYGVDETGTAVQAGAAKALLVTDNLIQKTRQEDKFEKINRIMKTADKIGATIHIISSDHEGGKKLDGLGGIAAILRYKMNY